MPSRCLLGQDAFQAVNLRPASLRHLVSCESEEQRWDASCVHQSQEVQKAMAVPGWATRQGMRHVVLDDVPDDLSFAGIRMTVLVRADRVLQHYLRKCQWMGDGQALGMRR